jgi:Trm5-related predicted tRNA methylase
MSNKSLVALDELVKQLSKEAKLDSWNSFVTELKVPQDIIPAIITGRPELLMLATPRAMSAEEVKDLYKLIGGLVETNIALREHTAKVAQLVDNWGNNFKALQSIGEKIRNFANFKLSTDEEPVDDEN